MQLFVCVKIVGELLSPSCILYWTAASERVESRDRVGGRPHRAALVALRQETRHRSAHMFSLYK